MTAAPPPGAGDVAEPDRPSAPDLSTSDPSTSDPSTSDPGAPPPGGAADPPEDVAAAAATGVRDPEPAPEADGTWKRMHPVTPLVRGWAVLAVLLFFVVQQRGERAFSPGEGGGGGDAFGRFQLLFTLGLVGVGALVVAAWAYVTWRFTRFRVGEEVVELRTGVLFRQHRRVRLDRLQAVDVVQPLVARLTGLSELKLEVAGGSGSDVSLAYLRSADAQRLRRTLLARAAGVQVDETGEAPEAPEREVLQVPVDRLLLSMLRSVWPVIGAVALVVLVVVVVVTGEPGIAFGLVPAALGVATGVWGAFSRGFGFRIAASPDGLRLRHGLTETRAQTVPPGRVQAVRLRQPLLWRGPDWWAMEMDVAGYAGGGADDAGKETVLLPVGTRAQAVEVLSLLLPDPGCEDPAGVLGAGLEGTGRTHGWVDAPRSARWLDPVAWRRRGYRTTGTALLVRSGRLVRQLDVVPHERTQSLGLEQGPLQRRLGLATVTAHATPGPVRPRAEHLAAPDAARLLAEQAARARAARSSAGPERWMEDLAAASRGAAGATGGTREGAAPDAGGTGPSPVEDARPDVVARPPAPGREDAP
ncbi:PH domain-containing protein [uncultured Pseudokineococcus sp.]|uniref:PH domain-containing protein n=1 Tax=uncultured Pseudokineococcus sp. TaxID=1642928 RepID=UPI00262249FD|nr:PH domain-containing protein [uncultured Pseudokineococcus sp.]